MDLVLIRLVDVGFNVKFSDCHCRYTGGSGFIQISGDEFQ